MIFSYFISEFSTSLFSTGVRTVRLAGVRTVRLAGVRTVRLAGVCTDPLVRRFYKNELLPLFAVRTI